MDLQQRINAFVKLGDFLSQFSSESFEKKDHIAHNDLFFDGFKHQIKLAKEHNGWFNKENVVFALNGWSNQLTNSNINKWLSKYEFNTESLKTIAIVMAGNIPLVGFHDVLSVLISGHNVLIKQSTNDQRLLPILLEYLISVEPIFVERISYVENRMTGHEAVIATGSNNTSRYFDYYFKDVPNIIRKNRQSVAILNGNETPEQLQLLSDDIFRYYGMGCRNVSKIFVPESYNFNNFFENIYKWKEVINDNKYANNYDYNKAVYLMSGAKMLDNNYILVKEDDGFNSPIGVLFYETYTSLQTLETKLNSEKEELQCIVTNNSDNGHIPFGNTQQPKLWDYADGVDTVNFLLKLH